MDGVENAKDNEDTNKESMDKLEDALVICGFGKFHINMTFWALAAAASVILTTLSTSFVLPIAECDLHMDDAQKGLLTSMTYFGLLTATLFVSFLADNFGRKQFLIYGSFGSFICRIIEGFSQNFWTLLLGKYLEGIFCSFCYPGAMVLLSECVHKNGRDNALLIFSSLLSVHTIILVLISWAILPQKWDFVLIDGYLEIHSWNIYFIVCSIWGLLSGVAYCFLPESPKYLLTSGKPEEALEVLKSIYSINTGMDRDSFPIKSLHPGTSTYKPGNKISIKKKITEGLFKVKFLFKKPLNLRLLFFSIVGFVIILSHNTLRGWYPQLSTIAENYEAVNNKTEYFCVVLTEHTKMLYKDESEVNLSTLVDNYTIDNPKDCVKITSGSNTYMSGVILGIICVVSVAVATYMLKFISNKTMTLFILLSSTSCLIGLGWVHSALQTAILLCVAIGLLNLCFSYQMSMVIRAFPTDLRSLASAIIAFIGRLASIVGNNMFPVLLQTGCMVPFGVLSAMLLCVACLVYFMPNPKQSADG